MTTNNTNANPCETMEITFRNKFEKLLTDGNRAAIVSAVKKFCSFNADYAIKSLWSLTCGLWADKTLERLELSEEIVGDVTALRNELRYQYELRHPDFLNLDVPSTCLPAFEALKNKTDAIVANVIFGYCISHIHLDANTVQYSLELLSSDAENRYFGGIRSLSARLSYPEATYLKNVHMEIHDLLKALYEDKCQNEVPSGNLPFANLDERIKEAGIQLVPTAAPTAGQKPKRHISGGSTPAVEVNPQATSSTPGTPCGEMVEANNVAKPGTAIPILTVPHEEVSSTASSDAATEINPDTGFASLNAPQILRYQEHFNALLSSEALANLIILRDSGFDLNEIIDKEKKISSFLQVSEDLIA